MSGPLLEANGIDFSYGRLQVLFEVDIAVAAGEALALLGTNGAGKSTLLRVIAGLAAPTKGRVALDGHDVTGVPAEDMVKRGVVLVSGGRAVFTDLSVEENLLVQTHTIRDRAAIKRVRARVFDTFPRVRERLNSKAGNLSGGEQQQLALAKALMLEPKVLCIDELSLGLAPVVVQELLEVVRRIHNQGVTVVLVEQSLNIAAELCGRAVFMEKGAIRFEGSPRELIERDDIARAVFLGAPTS
jgi:ABC-type branched-subunit amino acid transport system ATPase component